MLATLALFADELTVYPGSDIRPQDGDYALAFAIPMGTPGLKFVCRDTFARVGATSTIRFVALRRDGRRRDLRRRRRALGARLPLRRHGLLLGGHPDTGWRYIMHQAFTRAYTKLLFAFGLGHLIANTTGVVRFDHIQEKPGRSGTWSS